MPKCPFCFQQSHLLYRLEDFSIFCCKNCAYCFSNASPPIPKDFYEKHYFKSHFFKQGYENYEKETTFLEHDFNRRLDRLQQYLSKNATFTDLRLLDIGCATGTFLNIASLRGMKNIYGLDVSIYASKKAHKKKFNIYNLDIEEHNHDFEQKYACFFDVVTAFDVIEHCSNPILVLQKIWQLLKPQGILYLSTPNISSLSVSLMKKKWPHFKKEHLHYFSPTSIRRLLENKGFGNIIIFPTTTTTTFSLLMKKLGFTSLAKWFDNDLFNMFQIKIKSGEMDIIAPKSKSP